MQTPGALVRLLPSAEGLMTGREMGRVPELSCGPSGIGGGFVKGSMEDQALGQRLRRLRPWRPRLDSGAVIQGTGARRGSSSSR